METPTWAFRKFPGRILYVSQIAEVAEEYGSRFFSNAKFHASRILDTCHPVVEGVPEGVRASMFITSEKRCFDDYTRVFTIRLFVEVAKDMNPDYGCSLDHRFDTTVGHLIQNLLDEKGDSNVGMFASNAAARREFKKLQGLAWPELFARFSNEKYPLQVPMDRCSCCNGRGYIRKEA